MLTITQIISYVARSCCLLLAVESELPDACAELKAQRHNLYYCLNPFSRIFNRSLVKKKKWPDVNVHTFHISQAVESLAPAER